MVGGHESKWCPPMGPQLIFTPMCQNQFYYNYRVPSPFLCQNRFFWIPLSMTRVQDRFLFPAETPPLYGRRSSLRRHHRAVAEVRLALALLPHLRAGGGPAAPGEPAPLRRGKRKTKSGEPLGAPVVPFSALFWLGGFRSNRLQRKGHPYSNLYWRT